jgi:hypothetical protein
MGQRSRVSRHGVFVLLFCVGGLLALVPPALAKTYTPDKTGDSPSGGLSLREAITKANNHPGSDKVLLEGGKTYKLSIPGQGEDANATGDLDILNASLQVKSDSDKLAKVNAQGLDRVFDLISGSGSFQRVAISGGSAPLNAGGGVNSVVSTDLGLKLIESRVSGNTAGAGGGIVSLGPLTVKKSKISGNSASSNTGGIFSRSATIDKSTISNNSAVGALAGAGGISFQSGTGTINRSTISGNFAYDAGGISTNSAVSLSVTNSTIANNIATNWGGGMLAQGTTSLSSVTVARSRAGTGAGSFGGGIFHSVGTVVVRNSIIALNTVGAGGGGPDCYGTYTSVGVNLFTNLNNCTGFGPPNILTSNPKLGSLKNNGGSTKTIELKKGSPAINNAGSGSPKRDQRGEKRKKPDIGAFERR